MYSVISEFHVQIEKFHEKKQNVNNKTSKYVIIRPREKELLMTFQVVIIAIIPSLCLL